MCSCMMCLLLSFLILPIFTTTASQPNIVFLLADDFGYNDIGYHNPAIITPYMDLLASQGVILEQSYVQPMCTPTRSALLTGTYPFRIGRRSDPLTYNQPTGLTLERSSCQSTYRKRAMLLI
eukprot:TRINITY_DN11396_c0_g1_i1.p1 TRINITY_DN11396_c0_g1~~TRINITY_DN11396_c0_g1_i1.p1  ORF type:complete len:122 (-),score=17.07 TRINITY_DN11396_c0_g1_i1:59-424(-)